MLYLWQLFMFSGYHLEVSYPGAGPHPTSHLRPFLCLFCWSNFGHIVRNYLNETFPGRWIGRDSPRFWVARSRDLTPVLCMRITSRLRRTRWKLGICSTCVNAFRQLCIQLPSNDAACVQAHRGEMATLLGYGGQSCRTAMTSLNYGVFFHIINISFKIKCIFPEMVRDFSGTLYYRRTLATMSHDNSDAVGIIMPGTCHA